MFDFDATLPLMAVQFLLLAAVLNAVFYKPLSKAIDERSEYIRTNEVEARERLAKAEQLAKQYEEQLAVARRQAQSVIAAAQEDAKKIAQQKNSEAVAEVQARLEQTRKEIDEQKQAAMTSLEQEVDALSRQILEKLLGPSLANR
ncbi:F0F1 ATP synthase subunit B' [Phormidium sp. LEGE 05292]|uniref:F0F1 ATP synthase subunit B' n=1 Tax=[Phormidium] sp. LEGE 05292 TaxID=767427 RepID=UPI00187EE501|nr:F0F1 ATP synthase subunit B' [Phormidium sp. LEGE 05292]MBE9229184.1 F0F1 ATP synthase subunit B' [Phormidium sp. LEGE 05292]